MAAGTVSTRILTDIANAIRQQNGGTALYKPRQMAAAVAALDGTKAGTPGVEPYMTLESGVLPESVFSDIADAIRAQNGLATRYAPGDMAQAILDLVWDVGVKVRAMLLTDGTLEFNYRDGRSSDLGTIAQCWEVDPTGYSSDSARPWHAARAQVRRVVFDSDFSGAGITNFGYWCTGMNQMTEVVGFEECSGAVNVTQMFNSCGKLETIWATSFDNTAITSYTSVLYGCNRLVGQTGYVPTTTAGKAALTFGASGVLTNPLADQRTWASAHLHDGGALEITGSATPDATRTVLATGRVSTNAHYQLNSAMPWYDERASLRTCEFLADLSVPVVSMDYWFYTNTGLTGVTGWGNVSGLRSMRMAFNGCTGLVTLDLCGLDPSSLKDLFYAFAGCGNLTKIYADATWALPSSGVSGMNTFYNDTRLVGGNGTAYSSSAAGYARMVIDRAGQAGYLTAS